LRRGAPGGERGEGSGESHRDACELELHFVSFGLNVIVVSGLYAPLHCCSINT
jgi:hypothetical protein